MKKNGFTLIELLATLVVLGLVVGITVASVSSVAKNAKDKTEKVFVETINDAIEVYLSSDAKNLVYSTERCRIQTRLGESIIYETGSNITFSNIINSSYHPLTESEFKNPKNKTKTCKTSASIRIFRDSEYVYYYYYKGSNLGCLETETGIYSTLPESCNIS